MNFKIMVRDATITDAFFLDMNISEFFPSPTIFKFVELID